MIIDLMDRWRDMRFPVAPNPSNLEHLIIQAFLFGGEEGGRHNNRMHTPLRPSSCNVLAGAVDEDGQRAHVGYGGLWRAGYRARRLHRA